MAKQKWTLIPIEGTENFNLRITIDDVQVSKEFASFFLGLNDGQIQIEKMLEFGRHVGVVFVGRNRVDNIWSFSYRHGEIDFPDELYRNWEKIQIQTLEVYSAIQGLNKTSWRRKAALIKGEPQQVGNFDC